MAPPERLVQLIAALEAKLRELGVDIRLCTSVDKLEDGPTVISTSAVDCSRLLGSRAPEVARSPGSIDMVPLPRVTAFQTAGLPHHDLPLESTIQKGLTLPEGVWLAGKYLLGIGLPILVERAWNVAAEVSADSR